MALTGILYMRIENGDYIPLGSYQQVKERVEGTKEWQQQSIEMLTNTTQEEYRGRHRA